MSSTKGCCFDLSEVNLIPDFAQKSKFTLRFLFNRIVMNSCELRVYINFFQCQLVLQHLTLNRAEFLQHLTLHRAEFLQHLTIHRAEFLQHLTLHRAEFPQHDAKSCRISASLDVTTCIVHILNVERILSTFTMFNKPCSGKWNICTVKCFEI